MQVRLYFPVTPKSAAACSLIIILSNAVNAGVALFEALSAEMLVQGKITPDLFPANAGEQNITVNHTSSIETWPESVLVVCEISKLVFITLY